ncbi:MAG: hypothetical protein QXO69_00920 [archaeon]
MSAAERKAVTGIFRTRAREKKSLFQVKDSILKRIRKTSGAVPFVGRKEMERIILEKMDEANYKHGVPASAIHKSEDYAVSLIEKLAKKEITDRMMSRIIENRGSFGSALAGTDAASIKTNDPEIIYWRHNFYEEIKKNTRTNAKPPSTRAVFGAIGIVLKEMEKEGYSFKRIISDPNLEYELKKRVNLRVMRKK